MQCQEKLKMLIEQLRNPNDLDISLTMEFGPFETVHKWKRMSECYEFVGARRSKHTAVAYKDAIYVFGGDNGKSMLNDLIRFDIKEKSWTKMGCMGAPPAPRYHHSAVVYKTSMFVFGGYTGDILANSNLTNKNDLFEYKFPNAQWVQWKFTGQEPVPRSAHGAAVYDAKLWIFAGYDGNARLNDMWTIKLEGDNHQWERVEQKGQCPPTCCNFPVAVARGSMFVFSGQSGAKITNALFQFHFETHTWSRVCTEHLLRCAGPAPARRYGHVMLAHERHLYVFGGAADNTLPNDVHCYDLDTQMWSVVQTSSDSQVPSGRLFHAGAVVDDAMYIFGGTVDNNVRSGELFRFQLSNYPRCTLHDDFGAILKSQQFCDVTLLLGEKQEPIMAHQAMLAARSQFLKAKIKEARAELTKTLDENEHKSLDIDDIAVNEVTKSNSPENEPDEDNEENIAFNKINDMTLNKMTTVEDKSPDTNKTTSDDETEIDIDDVNSNNKIYDIDNVNEVFKLVNSDYKALEANKVSAAEEIVLERNKTKDVESPSDDHNEIAPKFSKIATYGQSKSDTPEVSIGMDVKNPATVDRSVKARLRKPKPLAPLTIAIPEASLDSFKMLLKYIYTDRIDPTEIDEDPASSSTMLLVIEVLRLALTLRIPRLAGLCARFLRAKLCCANVLAALSAAHNAKLDSIKEYCLRFVVKDYNFTPIVMSKDFEFIEQCLMVEIIRRRQQPAQKQANTQSTEYDDDINGTTLEQDMCFFLTGGSGYELADVTLMVGKSARPAHRSVLAARAAFFEAMFRSFEPQDNIVNIQICDTVPSVESVDSLMRYIYYGDTNMPPEDSLYLFQAPVYYGFTNNRLQVFCQHNLHNSVTQENVLAILQAADRTRATDIKEYALDMVVHHFCKVSRQPAVRNLDQRILVDIVLAIADWIDSLKLETLPILPRSLRKSISAMTIMEDQDFKQGTSK